MRKTMLSKYASTLIVAAGVAALTFPSFSQSPELQQKVAAIRQAVAANKAALLHYSWTETQQTLLNGEVKSTKVSQCMYGPDGNVQKTPIGSSPAPGTPGGIRGRVIQKKKDEIQDYMERVASLIQRYTPPDPQQMQSSFQNGNAAVVPSEGNVITVTFNSYAIPGDSVTVTFDASLNTIMGFKVKTYLDSPSDVVTLNVVFATLPGGPNYVNQSVLDATAKGVQIRTTSSGYARLN